MSDLAITRFPGASAPCLPARAAAPGVSRIHGLAPSRDRAVGAAEAPRRRQEDATTENEMARKSIASSVGNTNDSPLDRVLDMFGRALRRAAGSRWVAADAVACSADCSRRQAQRILAGQYGPQLRHLVPILKDFDDPWLLLAVLADRVDTLSPEARAEAERLVAILEGRDE